MDRSSHVTFRMLNPDEYPPNGECLGCGIANDLYKEIDGTVRPMRFFMVSGTTLPKQHWGIYCERCMEIANATGKEMKKINQHFSK